VDWISFRGVQPVPRHVCLLDVLIPSKVASCGPGRDRQRHGRKSARAVCADRCILFLFCVMPTWEAIRMIILRELIDREREGERERRTKQNSPSFENWGSREPLARACSFLCSRLVECVNSFISYSCALGRSYFVFPRLAVGFSPLKKAILQRRGHIIDFESLLPILIAQGPENFLYSSHSLDGTCDCLLLLYEATFSCQCLYEVSSTLVFVNRFPHSTLSLKRLPFIFLSI
jgi:hypothetical protein